MAANMNRKFRVIPPDPNDPMWEFPYATRKQIRALRKYFSTFHKRKRCFDGGRHTNGTLDRHRKNKIPWESVPPWNRDYCQRWFDNKIAEYKSQGRTITPGIINSVRMNATRVGRYIKTSIAMGKYVGYSRKKALWLRFQEWESAKQRRAFVEATGGLQHKVLEI